MAIDIFNLTLSVTAFLIYGACCIISIIFTLFLPAYLKIEEKINLDILPTYHVTPLEENINFINTWIIEHNKIIGPLLILLSLIDLKLALIVINII